MSFSVHTAALRTFSGVLTTDQGASSRASSYVTDNLKIETGGLTLYSIYSNTPALAATISGTLTHLASIFGGSSAEIVKTANLYDHTDTTSAARLDAAYHDPGAGSVDPKTGAETPCTPE